MLVFKSIVTIEGMGRQLDPGFDILAVGMALIQDLIKTQYSMPRFSKELLWLAKDSAALLQVLPRQIRWMLRKFNANDFAFEIKSPDLENLRSQLDANGRRQSLTLLVVGCFVSASIALHAADTRTLFDYPVFAVFFFALGLLLLIRLLAK